MATTSHIQDAAGSATAMTGSVATMSSAYDTSHHESSNPIVRKVLIPLVIVVALSIGGYVAYEIVVNNKKPEEIVPLLFSRGQELIALLWNMVDKEAVTPPAGGQEVVVAPPEPEAPPPPEPEAPPPPEPVAVLEEPPLNNEPPPVNVDRPGIVPTQDSFMSDNPYVDLPNRMLVDKPQFSRAWSPQEEEVWRSGLTHQFAWQHYKTVQDVIVLRLAGSDAILWEALNSPRLWVRMKAVIGLAQFGMNVDSDTALRALGDERPSLVANYFKRFTISSTPSERFIMRYALRTVGPHARRHIIKALAVRRDELSDIYLVAGTIDKDYRVKRRAEVELQRINLPPELLEKHRNQIAPPDH